MMMNHTYYYSLMIHDRWWTNCVILSYGTNSNAKVSHLFKDLKSSKAFKIIMFVGKSYRFRVRMTSNLTAQNSSWSDYKLVSTLMEP